MKTAKKSMLINAIGSGLFLISALFLYIFFFYLYPQPIMADLPSETRAKIQESKDIEKLRSVALEYNSLIQESIIMFNKLVKSLVYILILSNLLAGITYLNNIGLGLKLSKEQNGLPVPWWLKWL